MATINDVYNKVDEIAQILGRIEGQISKMPTSKGTGATGDDDDEKGNGRYSKLSKADAKKAKAWQEGIDAVVDFAKQVTDAVYAIKTANLQIRLAEISAASDKFVQNLSLASNTISVAMKGILITDPKAVVQQTLDNLKNTVELSTNRIKTENQKNLIEQQKRIEIQKAENEKTTALVGTVAAGVVAGLALVNPATLAVAVGLGVLSGAIQLGTHILKQSLSYQVKKLEQEKLITEKYQKAQEGTYELIDKTTNEWVDKVKPVIEEQLKINDEAHKLGRMFGFVGEGMVSYEKNMVRVNQAMAVLGMSTENYIKLQRGYIERTGRYGLLSENDATSMGALGILLGLSENETAGIAGGMQIFNKSAKESSETVWDMSQTAQMMGISSQKFAKDLEKNLKLAQKYDFRNGTKGLMDMALFAQRIRMDMSQMDAILAGFHTGNIEDVITKAAHLNVLGGNAALISDPIGMLYDAYANPKGMMGRVLQSISGMGFFNTRTGETEFGIAERMRIEQIAKSLGMSPETLTEMARQENKGRELNRLYGANAFGKYGEMVKQNAFFENGKWRINTLNGTMDLDAMRGNDKLLSEIMPNSTEEQLVAYAQKQLSTQENIERNTRMGVSNVGADMHDAVIYTYDYVAETTKTIWEKYRKDYGEIGTLILNNVKTMQDEYMNVNMETIKGLIDQRLIQAVNDFRNNLEDASAILKGISQSGSINEFVQDKVMTPADYMDKKVSDYDSNFQFFEKTLGKHPTRIYKNKETGEFLEVSSPTAEKEFENGVSDIIMKTFRYRGGPLMGRYKAYTGEAVTVKDAIVEPGGKVIEPDSQDFKVLLQKGGTIQQMLGGSQSANSEVPRSINVSGSLFLNTNGQSVDLVELINRNPEEFYRVTSSILFPTNGQSRVNV